MKNYTEMKMNKVLLHMSITKSQKHYRVKKLDRKNAYCMNLFMFHLYKVQKQTKL